MARQGGRCPTCRQVYPWGTTVCPSCHVGLELPGSHAAEEPLRLIFETWDRASADIVAGLLEAYGIRCMVRGDHDSIHAGLGSLGVLRVLVGAADESRAQEILDAEIGRGEDQPMQNEQ
jgi:hypothetical protein